MRSCDINGWMVKVIRYITQTPGVYPFRMLRSNFTTVTYVQILVSATCVSFASLCLSVFYLSLLQF